MTAAVGRWLVGGMPGLDYVIVGYWVVGAFLGLYLGICGLMGRNPANFDQLLTDKTPDGKRAVFCRIALLIVALINLFVPGASLFVGIFGHLFFVSTGSKSNPSGAISLFFAGMLLIGFIGAFVIASGIIPLNPEEN